MNGHCNDCGKFCLLFTGLCPEHYEEHTGHPAVLPCKGEGCDNELTDATDKRLGLCQECQDREYREAARESRDNEAMYNNSR